VKGKINKAGVYRVPIEEYHRQPCAGPSISSSGLRTIFIDSPAHYWVDSPLNPNRIEKPGADHFDLGRASHTLLLGEDAFTTLFVVRPERWDSWRTNDAKAWKAEQEAAGRTVLLPQHLQIIRGMAKSLAASSLVQAGILNGKVEQTFAYQDKETGVWLLSRPDAVPTDSGDFCDLKTTARIGFGLDRSIFDYRYDMQASLTKWAAKAVLGLEMQSFSFVFVEKEPPHCVDVLQLHAEDIAAAELDLRVAVDVFAHCLKSGTWFGPAGSQNDARYVQLSDFAKKGAEFRRDFLRREIGR